MAMSCLDFMVFQKLSNINYRLSRLFFRVHSKKTVDEICLTQNLLFKPEFDVKTRKFRRSTSEIVTITVGFHLSDIRTFKHFNSLYPFYF